MADGSAKFQLLYTDDTPIKGKIERVAKDIYGASAVEVGARRRRPTTAGAPHSHTHAPNTHLQYSEEAERKIAAYTEQGYANLPVCMAKTHLSLSTDPSLKGVPTGFTVTVRDVRASVGAGCVLAAAAATAAAVAYPPPLVPGSCTLCWARL